MTTIPATLTSRSIGETENALHAVLLRSLAGTGLDYYRWVALKLINESPPPMSRTAVLDMLQQGLRIESTAADVVISDLEKQGLVTDAGGSLNATARGAALYGRLNDEIRRLVARLWEGLDIDELAIAQRVLATIAERANVLLAG